MSQVDVVLFLMELIAYEIDIRQWVIHINATL